MPRANLGAMASDTTHVAQNWQPRLGGEGVVTNLADIAQSITFILCTPRKSLPLDPEFGCDLHRYIDLPANRARAPITREAMQALQRCEPRIVVDRITYTPTIQPAGERARLRVTWHVRDGVLNETEVTL